MRMMLVIGCVVALICAAFAQIGPPPPALGSITGLGAGVATALGDAANTAGGAVTSTVAVANGGTGDTGTAWTTYTPTVTCGSGGPPTTYTAAGRYKLLGKTVHLQVQVVITAVGTCATSIDPTLPVSANSTGIIYPLGGYISNTGVLFSAVADSGIVIMTTAPANDTYYAGGVYESN